jgi:antitoxin component YwqK of YwqJK toxin-antitoxin module
MDNIIGYFKITPYIYEIEILYVHQDNRVLTNQQKLNAKFEVIIFQVLSIKHMVTQMVYLSMNNYEVAKVYEELKHFYLTYDRAFNENFFNNKEYQLFPDGYTGIYSSYDDNGNIISTFYHANGKIHGEALIYNKEGYVKMVYYYKKGKLKIKYNIDLDEVIRY